MRLGNGSSGRRTLQTPANTGTAARAERRLAATANQYVAKLETALAVDGISFIIWNKNIGHFRCACKNGAGKVFAASDTSLSVPDDADVSPSKQTKPIAARDTTSNRNVFVPVDELVYNPTGGDTIFSSSGRDRVTNQDVQDVIRNVTDFARQKPSNQVGTEDDALIENLDDLPDADGLLTDVLINCPICFGSGYTDAWQPDNGIRLPLDLSGRFTTNMGNVDLLEDSAVPKFEVSDKQYIEWSVNLPVAWMRLPRATLYNEDEIVTKGRYVISLTLPDSTVIPFTYSALQALKNNPLAAQGPVKFKVMSVDDNPVQATHFELVYLTGQLTRGQMPEVEVPNDDEFADWNLNTSIELSPRSNIKEGSYVVDGKYRKVWKVDSYTRKQLSTGQTFGFTANIRALHTFEKMYTLMNLYKR